MERCKRREFLNKLILFGGGVLVSEFLPPIDLFFPEEPQPKRLPFQEILKRYPNVNRKITAVNLSCVPNEVPGQYSGLHHPKESLVMAVPYKETEKGELKIYGYAPGLKEAIGRGHTVVLVIEIPFKSEQHNSQFWLRRVERIAEYFKGASAFIIGNEVNADYSSWRTCLKKYQDLYLASYRKIKTISPRSSIMPWSEAYFGKGDILEKFLAAPEVRGKIDGLAINVYDISAKIEPRVNLYRRILSQFGLASLPVMISELGKPINYSHTTEEQARLVIQNLATAAYLQEQGLIEIAAWYCAYSGPDSEHSLSTSSLIEFKPKPSLFAFLLSQRLLVGKIDLTKNPSGLVEVAVSSQDQPSTLFIWNEGEENIIIPPKPGYRRAWTPTGERLSPIHKVTLYPSSKPFACAGSTAVFAF